MTAYFTPTIVTPGTRTPLGRTNSSFAVLGPYDFINGIEVPDNETVAHLSVDLGSRGTANIVTLPAMALAELSSKLKEPSRWSAVDTGPQASTLRCSPT